MSMTPDGEFEKRLQPGHGEAGEDRAPATARDDPDMPRQRSVSVSDPGMGDLLRFDAERLRILIERHLLHTGSARAPSCCWTIGTQTLAQFVKVMPTDYARRWPT